MIRSRQAEEAEQNAALRHNLLAHMMHDAANVDALGFEAYATAVKRTLRDEVKRLKATELAVMEDPLARTLSQGAVNEAGSRIEKPEAYWPAPKAPKSLAEGKAGRSKSGKPGTRAYKGPKRGR